MKYVIKIVLLMLLLNLFPQQDIYAQSASLRYDQGVALYQKEQYRDAIKFFNEAMILNKSAANRNKCKKMIDRCNKALKNRERVKVEPRQPVQLTVDRDSLYFEGRQAGADIVKVSYNAEWTFVVEPADASWCLVEKTDDNTFLRVRVFPSGKTIPRSAVVTVTPAGEGAQPKQVKIVQGSGSVPVLTVEPQVLDGVDGKKGEICEVKVNCTSDTVYYDKRNWTVRDYPDWVGFQEAPAGQASPDRLTMTIYPNLVPEKRESYVTLQSQDVTCKIVIKQGKGKKRK